MGRRWIGKIENLLCSAIPDRTSKWVSNDLLAIYYRSSIVVARHCVLLLLRAFLGAQNFLLCAQFTQTRQFDIRCNIVCSRIIQEITFKKNNNITCQRVRLDFGFDFHERNMLVAGARNERVSVNWVCGVAWMACEKFFGQFIAWLGGDVAEVFANRTQ